MLYKYNKDYMNWEIHTEINKYCQMYANSATTTQSIRYTVTNNPITLASRCKKVA
jgi:hypothetical protein